MPKKILTCLLPTLVAGCAGFHSPPPPQTPALVFVDGRILDSAEVIAQTQRRIAPPPVITSAPATPVVSGAPTAATAPLIPASRPASPSVASTATVSAVTLSRLQQTGKAGVAPVVGLAPSRNLTVAQWVQKLLPAGWQRLQANAATPALNTRLVSWSANDQWTRSLNRLLEEQHLYGVLDWDARALTVTTAPGTPTAVLAGTAVPTTPGATKAAGTTGSTASPFRSSAPAASPRWTAKTGATLRETLIRWAGTASCSSPAGEFWTVIWPDTVADYRLDAPLTFSGTFESMLGQVFALYATADTPLSARASRSQCVVAVSDQSAR